MLHAAIVCVLVVYGLVIPLYRVTYHPLANYPGPLWYRVSSWPSALRIGSGDWHLELHRLHQKYGDVVRWAPDALSFRSVQALHDIYASRDTNMIKTGWTDANVGLNNGKFNIVSCSDRKTHAQRRYLLAQALNDTNFRKAEPYILLCVRSLCAIIKSADRGSELYDEKEQWTGSLDIGYWSSMMTIDVLGELCFGKGFGALDQGSTHLRPLLMSAAKLTQQVAWLPIRHILYPILTSSYFTQMFLSKTATSRVAYRNEVKAVVQNRLTSADTSNAREDFFHHLLKAYDTKTGARLTPDELVTEALALIAAGNDTASTCIAAVFFYILHDSRVLAKLVFEISSTFTDVEDICSNRLKELPYLRAVIDESLRLSPPIPGQLTRRILPGGARIEGVQYPAGIVVGVSAYVLHHDEKYFSDVTSFIPERWIPGYHKDLDMTSTPRSIDVAKSAFCAFSLGPRGCIGKNMAYMEMSVTIARLLFLYDIRSPWSDTASYEEHGETKEYKLQDYFIADRQGPLVEFKERRV
ncbi:hypothetical protein FKW77_007765 [Venturia effusa]|uniref:Cytochrome P450 monooxygenase n=1 Tax=Venturia effusa TaxID=50376 RepID=A0A517LCM3_9PEZI|nr:hypothetical protein FKW77_007765 [Venturia effusa]